MEIASLRNAGPTQWMAISSRRWSGRSPTPAGYPTVFGTDELTLRIRQVQWPLGALPWPRRQAIARTLRIDAHTLAARRTDAAGRKCWIPSRAGLRTRPGLRNDLLARRTRQLGTSKRRNAPKDAGALRRPTTPNIAFSVNYELPSRCDGEGKLPRKNRIRGAENSSPARIDTEPYIYHMWCPHEVCL